MKNIFKIFVLWFALFVSYSFVAAENRFELPELTSELPGEGPMFQTSWFKKKWESRRSTFHAARERDRGAVVFLGDSITEGWGRALGAVFPEMKVANRGISGDTTRGVLIRLEEDVISLDPTAIVLLIGTNDLGLGSNPEAIARNLELVIQALKASNSEMPIILCEVFPSSEKKNRPSDQIQAINTLYMKIAKGDSQIVYMDTYDLFAGEDGDAKVSEFPDLLHPNEMGYAKWAAALRPIFASYGFREKESALVLEDGYELLFDGKTLNGWGYRVSPESDIKASIGWKKADPEGAADWPIVTEAVDFDGLSRSSDGRFYANNGRLTVTTPKEIRKIQTLWTQREFDQDFTLKLEFRATPNADSGIFLRGPQLQCRDYSLAGPWKELEHYKAQAWNEIVVTVKGNIAHCTCNGEVLIDAFELPDFGPIGLKGDRGQVEYRNIRIKVEN